MWRLCDTKVYFCIFVFVVGARQTDVQTRKDLLAPQPRATTAFVVDGAYHTLLITYHNIPYTYTTPPPHQLHSNDIISVT